jgi:integrase
VLADTKAEDSRIRSGGWLVNYYGKPIQDVDSSWRAMLTALKLPNDREWKSYLLRHSLATLLRGAGVQKWELEAWMGHSSASQTETYAVELMFPNVQRGLQALLDDLESRVPGALHRNGTGKPTNVIDIGRAKMPAG